MSDEEVDRGKWDRIRAVPSWVRLDVFLVVTDGLKDDLRELKAAQKEHMADHKDDAQWRRRLLISSVVTPAAAILVAFLLAFVLRSHG
jgi:CHASE3 domain sensor protein